MKTLKKKKLFERLLSNDEDKKKLLQEFRGSSLEEKREEVDYILLQLIPLKEDGLRTFCQKGRKRSYQYLGKILMGATVEPYAGDLVDIILKRSQEVLSQNRLIWMFVALGSTPRHATSIKKIMRRKDIAQDGQTYYFLNSAVRGAERRSLSEIEITSMLGLCYEGYHRVDRDLK